MNINHSHIKLMGNYLLINGVGNPISGFANGKAGIALVLFELAREFNEERFEDYAFLLLQEALLSKTEFVNFNNGLTGIGYVLLYLINNGFIVSDFDDIFAEKHKLILEKIADDSSEAECSEFFYFFEYYRMTGVVPKELASLLKKKDIDEKNIVLQYALSQMKNDDRTINIDMITEPFSNVFLKEFYQKFFENRCAESSIIATMKNKVLMSNIRRVEIVLLDALRKDNKLPLRIKELLMII